MFAYLNNKTFTIQSFQDEQPAILVGGATTADELRSAGVTEFSPSVPGERMPVVIDAAGGPIYAYISSFYVSGSDCVVGIDVAPDSPNGKPVVAETNLPCRVQLHANALQVLETSVSPRFLVTGGNFELLQVRSGCTYDITDTALTTVTLNNLPTEPGVFWLFSKNNIYISFGVDSYLDPVEGEIVFYGSDPGLDTTGPQPKIYGRGFHQCIWDGMKLHIIKMSFAANYTPVSAPA